MKLSILRVYEYYIYYIKVLEFRYVYTYLKCLHTGAHFLHPYPKPFQKRQYLIIKTIFLYSYLFHVNKKNKLNKEI